MITLKKLTFDNWFSYGANNEVDFDKNILTQLVGDNGAGKTSISLILQEVLYGKNIKNIKKQDIENRFTDKKGYSAELDFSKNGDEYRIELDRKSTIKLKLYKNGKDISSHKSTDTYKSIANIIGIPDFKVFTQLIYQSSTDSLEFLTATDTQRKRFLINLLQLEKYIELHELFKSAAREVNADLSTTKGKISTISNWINEHSKVNLNKFEKKKEVSFPEGRVATLERLKDELKNINSINTKINKNNEYKKQLEDIPEAYYLTSPPPFNEQDHKDTVELRISVGERLKSKKAELDKLSKLGDVCQTCGQEISQDEKKSMVRKLTTEKNQLEREYNELATAVLHQQRLKEEINKHLKQKDKFERLYQLIDNDLSSETLDKADLEKQISVLTSEIGKIKQEIEEIQAYNNKASAHNSKVDVIKEQMSEFKKQLEEQRSILDTVKEKLDILELLKKTFSTNGLISYKIESSVKDLEKIINEYLRELSSFQIYFKLDKDKLNIEVVDDKGHTTNVENLSTGERARVNIATVLAIRQTMSTLTSTKINLLFLDEVVGVIDNEGKDRLSELLLKENLNTFIVAHSYEHPLIPRVYISKDKNISRIEQDA